MPINCMIYSTEPELVLFVACSGIFNLKDVEKFSAFFEEYLFADQQFKVLYDLRQVENMKLEAISAIVKHMIKYEKWVKNKLLGSSAIVNSAIVENLVNGLFAIRKPTTPFKITSDIQKACDFLNEISPNA